MSVEMPGKSVWRMPEWMEPFCGSILRYPKEQIERCMNMNERKYLPHNLQMGILIKEIKFKVSVLEELYQKNKLYTEEEGYEK